MRTIVLTAALALAAASAGAASAQQQHRDRGGPGQGSPAPATTPAAPAASQARSAAPLTGEAEIFLYGAKNYAGPANRITGAFPDTNLGGINSVRLNGQTWRICSGPNYTGSCVNLSQSVPEFAAYFGPPVIRSLKRIDTPAPAAPVPPVASGPRPGGSGGYPSGGQGRPPHGQGSGGSGGYPSGDQGRPSYGQGSGGSGGYPSGDQGRPSYGQGSGGSVGYPSGDQGRPSYGHGSGGDWTSTWRTARYLCSGGMQLTAAFDDRNGAVRIRTDRHGPFTLRQFPSRSGFRYEGAGRTFSGRADQATLAIGDSYLVRCRVE